MAVEQIYQFSLLSWNVKPKIDVEKVKYLFGCKADIYFLQEVIKGTFQSLEGKLTTRKYQAFYLKENESRLKRSCIIYNKDHFEVYENSCVLDEKIWPPWKGQPLPSDRPFQELNTFATANTDKTVCVAVLKFKSIPDQLIIVASCHVLTKCGCRVDYAKNILMQLDQMGRNIGCPVIVAGDFNCDLIQEGSVHFLVPKYNPTIHRVICSGGNSKPCIDFFAYKNLDENLVIKVDKVVANLACESELEGVLSEDKYKFLQYKNNGSTLDKIHKLSDHDPLTATLTIAGIEQPKSHFKVLYFNLEYAESDMIVNSMLDGLDPKPDICIFQKVATESVLACVDRNFKLFKCKPFCFIAYDSNKLKGEECKIITSEDPTSVAQVIRCKFTCHNLSGSPSFILATCDTNCGEIKGKEKKKSHAENLFKLVEDDSPVVLVGQFCVDLFVEESVSLYDFTLLKYAPTMYRMTHPYCKKPIYVCRDFFAFKDLQDRITIEIQEETVCAETIIPPRDLMIGKYHVSYDLIKSNLELLETLSATITISGSSQETNVSESESDPDPDESDSDPDPDESDSGSANVSDGETTP